MSSLGINIEEFVNSLSPEDEELFLETARDRTGGFFGFKSLEELVCSPEGFDLDSEGTVTNCQRAVLRIMTGEPLGELAEDPLVKELVGHSQVSHLEGIVPFEVVLLAAIRTAKSLIAAAAAIWASQTVDMTQCGKSRVIPRYPILSLERDNATETFGHLIGALQQPRLAHLRVAKKSLSSWREIIDESGADVVGNAFLWHPSGRPVEVRVVAGKRAGGSTVSRWLAGACLDEAPRMLGASEGVINYDDTVKSILGRILDRGQILSIGSPWAAIGPVYDKYVAHFGHPTAETVVLKATGPAMNPVHWTAERCERMRRKDATAYKTDVLAEFADAEEQLYPLQVIKESIRREPMIYEFDPHYDYLACLDPATRRNACTFVIFRKRGIKFQMAYCDEWLGTALAPVRFRQVFKEMAEILSKYGLDWCYTDEWSADPLHELAELFGIDLILEDWTQKEKTDAYSGLGVWMADGRVELAPHPMMEKDFKSVRRRASVKGMVVQIKQTEDGRHGDFAAATARCLKQHLNEEIIDPPEEGSEKWWQEQEEAQVDREIAKYGGKGAWWAKGVGVEPEEDI
jgi:hypothetical protein